MLLILIKPKVPYFLLISAILLLSKNLFSQEYQSWQGTGFALNKGYVVTNWHVADDADELYIIGVNGDFHKSYKAIVAKADIKNDLALLKIVDENFSGFGEIPYRFMGRTGRKGEEVFAIGYPNTTYGSQSAVESKLTKGIINALSGPNDNPVLYQHDATTNHGSSGGPLFSPFGLVMGVTSAGEQINMNGLPITLVDNVNYAIKVAYLIPLIESVDKSIIPTGNKVEDSNLSLADRYEILEKYVFYVFGIKHTSSSKNKAVTSGVSFDTTKQGINYITRFETDNVVVRQRMTKKLMDEFENFFGGKIDKYSGIYAIALSDYLLGASKEIRIRANSQYGTKLFQGKITFGSCELKNINDLKRIANVLNNYGFRDMHVESPNKTTTSDTSYSEDILGYYEPIPTNSKEIKKITHLEHEFANIYNSKLEKNSIEYKIAKGAYLTGVGIGRDMRIKANSKYGTKILFANIKVSLYIEKIEEAERIKEVLRGLTK